MHLNISPCNTGARLDAHIQTHTQEVTSSGTYCMIRIHRSIEPWTFKLFLFFQLQTSPKTLSLPPT